MYIFKNILTIQIKNNNKINITFYIYVAYIIIIRIIALIYILQRALCCAHNFNV